jgi:hypothetical protein
MTPRRPTLTALAVALLAAGVLAALPSYAATYVYTCILNPRQEVPPVASAGLGAGRFVIDTDANTVTYRIVFAGMATGETAAHIHGPAAQGVGGGVLFALAPGNPKVGVWNYAEGLEADILAGRTYANIHSAANPGGELRGQIVQFNALLDAKQEVPANLSTATGWATGMADTALNTISYYIFHEGLTGAPTNAHFHGNALHATSVGVKAAIAFGASPMTGTVGYLQADESALLSGRMYVNIHTAAFPGGEVRGQFVPVVIPIDATQEFPATGAATAAAFSMVAVDTLTNALSYDERIVALSATETAAHIHGFAGTGANAGVLSAQVLGTQKIGVWGYGAANEDNVRDGLTYFNVHTTAFPGGEIRGQIVGLPIAPPPPVLGVGGTPRLTGGLEAAPNPFGARTVLSFQLARTGSVSLSIVGVDGRVVRDVPAATYAPGPHSFEWDGRDDEGRTAAPGVYFARIRTPDGEHTTRLARLR